MKLRYTTRAAAELEAALAYIDERSPQGARHVKSRIRSVVALLIERPYAGRTTSRNGLRRIVAYPYPYLIFYRVTDTEIIVHGVRHAAHRAPSKL